jgi:cyanate permease
VLTHLVALVGPALGAGGSARAVSLTTAGCGLFGLGVGNLATLPGLILAVECPRERFAGLVSLAVGIHQFTFAFGPSLVGVLRDLTGGYTTALAACMTLEALGALLVLLGPGRSRGAESRARGRQGAARRRRYAWARTYSG